MSPVAQSTEVEPHLSLQEQALATAMLHRIGNATVNFAIGSDGIRYHQNPPFEAEDFSRLTAEFRQDPKESLAWARESLFAIGTDERLSASEKEGRLGRYLDAYFDLNLKLDHAAFPPSAPGEINEGVPDYVPDGFVDMGGDSDTDPDSRGREMILIDKMRILQKYKLLLKEIFNGGMNELAGGNRKKAMAESIAEKVYFSMPYDYAGRRRNIAGKKVPLSEITETVCRHHALVFQVLCQAVGVKSRLLKNDMGFEGTTPSRHSTNMARFDGAWYIFDPTIPDYMEKPDGQREWRPATFRVDRPPAKGEIKTWHVTTRNSNRKRTYIAHDDMYWFID